MVADNFAWSLLKRHCHDIFHNCFFIRFRSLLQYNAYKKCFKKIQAFFYTHLKPTKAVQWASQARGLLQRQSFSPLKELLCETEQASGLLQPHSFSPLKELLCGTEQASGLLQPHSFSPLKELLCGTEQASRLLQRYYFFQQKEMFC